MNPGALGAALQWIEAHPLLALLILIVSVAIEGFFIIGLFIPGAIIMFVAGAMVASDALPLLPMLLCASLGAFAGDFASFLVGRRLRGNLRLWCERWRVPGLLTRGEAFFRGYGGNSIVLGRFIGPVRPFLPAIAGAAGMPMARFVVSDLVAALLWAPVYAAPGLIIGATIAVAAEVGTRLALVLTLLVLSIWGLWLLIRFCVWLLQERAERWIARTMDWSHRHRRLGRLGPALADPDQPETPILAACTLALLLIGWLLGILLWGWQTPRPPAMDVLAFDWGAGLVLPGLPALVSTLSAMASWESSLLLVLTGLLLFSSLRMPRAAAHFLASAVVGLLLGAILPGTELRLSPSTAASDAAPMLMLVVVLFSLAGLIATRHPPIVRSTLYAAAGVIVGLAALAKVLLGAVGISQLALSLGLGLTWTSLLLLGYRRHLRGTRSAPLALSLWLSVVALALPATWFWDRDLAAMPRAVGERPLIFLSGDWQAVAVGAAPERLNLIWAGPLQRIEQALRVRGWRDPLPRDRESMLNWLRRDAAATQRPLVPQALAGQLPSLELIGPSATSNRSHVIRLWPARLHARGRGPVWHGIVGEPVERNLAGLARIPVARRSDASLHALRAQFDDTGELRERDGSPVLLLETP